MLMTGQQRARQQWTVYDVAKSVVIVVLAIRQQRARYQRIDVSVTNNVERMTLATMQKRARQQWMDSVSMSRSAASE